MASTLSVLVQSRDLKTFSIQPEGEPEQVLTPASERLPFGELDWGELGTSAESQPVVPDAEGDGGVGP